MVVSAASEIDSVFKSSINDDDDVIMSPVLKNINKITFMNAFFFTLPEKFFVQFEIATIGFFL